MPRPRALPLVLLALCAAACSSTPDPQHFTRLWPDGKTGVPFIGTSTEDGVLVLAKPEWQVGDLLEIQFPFGNSLVVDKGRIDRLNDTLAVVHPLTARLREGRFAAELPLPGEEIYVALRDENDEPVLVPAPLWHGGDFGDWITLPDRDATTVARDYAGTGVYVKREDRWEIVGVLAGLTAYDETESGYLALGFVGLSEMARILPDRLDYFARDVRPLRPDFEFGVPLQPGDLVYEEPAPEEPAAKTPPVTPTFAPLPTMPVPKGPAPGAKPKGKTKPKSKPKPGAPHYQH
jgi:hypothetical protein